MNRPDKQTQSFIIRIWVEDERDALWRGHITHVPSGDKQPIQDFQDISTFISLYLNKMGVTQKRTKQLKQKIDKLTARLKK